MALSASTVSAGIAALSITGMTSIRDVGNIPDEVDKRACPILFPDPENWLDAGEGAIDEETTFGTASTRYWQVHRGYNYIYLHAEAGDGRWGRRVPGFLRPIGPLHRRRCCPQRRPQCHRAHRSGQYYQDHPRSHPDPVRPPTSSPLRRM